MFFPNDRRVAKEEIAVAPETGMVLLHKHGDDCMLVSDPLLPYGNLTAGLPAPLSAAAHPCHAEFILLITAQIPARRSRGYCWGEMDHSERYLRPQIVVFNVSSREKQCPPALFCLLTKL